jgi:peptidoglycan/LPS O-acetylase OafA/YrhL
LSAFIFSLSFHFETPATAALGYTLLAMFYTSLIAAPIKVESVQRVFRGSRLRAIGKFSYGMYIIHQIARPTLPVLIVRLAPLTGSITLTAVLCSVGWFFAVLGLAKLSYSLFESRFLRLKSRFAYATPAELRVQPIRSTGTAEQQWQAGTA